jgi:hypothetical protein
MTVVSSKEFATNQKRYYDLAVNEQVAIKRGKNLFYLICSTAATVSNTNIDETMYCEPDEDFYRSISIDELLERIHEDIHQWYLEKKQRYIFTRKCEL